VASHILWTATSIDSMTILYLATFIGGLLLAVRAMISGVERPSDGNPGAERSLRMSPATAPVFGVVFGAAGYLLTRFGSAGPWAVFVIVAALGGLAALATARLVTTWWSTAPASDVDDERYVLQGHIARVTKAIHADVDGEVTYEMGSRQHVLKARSFDAAALSVGTDVVIERVEGDVAYVEAWMEVEKRL
jgi:membrane protein implicated in regulation of membrane protease activity